MSRLIVPVPWTPTTNPSTILMTLPPRHIPACLCLSFSSSSTTNQATSTRCLDDCSSFSAGFPSSTLASYGFASLVGCYRCVNIPVAIACLWIKPKPLSKAHKACSNLVPTSSPTSSHIFVRMLNTLQVHGPFYVLHTHHTLSLLEQWPLLHSLPQALFSQIFHTLSLPSFRFQFKYYPFQEGLSWLLHLAWLGLWQLWEVSHFSILF